MSSKEKKLINKIFLESNEKMHRYALKKLESNIDADDAVEETFLKITKNINRMFELACDERDAYCFRILQNEIVNIIRERDRVIPVELEKVDFLNINNNNIGISISHDSIDCLESYDDKYDIEDEFEIDDMKKLHSYINNLTDDDKYLIDLRYNQKMKFKDIAKLLDIKEDVAKKRGQRILKKLKLCFKAGDKNVKNK